MPGFGPSCAQQQPIRTRGSTKGLSLGFGEMKGKTLIKISFKTRQNFFFLILFRLAATLRLHSESKRSAPFRHRGLCAQSP